MPEICSASAAKELGLKRYFTGVRCKHGHISERWVSSSICVVCWKARDPITAAHKYDLWRQKNLPHLKKYQAVWRSKNQAAIVEKRKKYHAENASLIVSRVNKWRKANPEKFKELAVTTKNRRRALKQGCGGEHTAADRRDILNAQKGRCAYCRKRMRKHEIEWDHIVALARGGSNDRRNIQALCSTCNRRKGAKHPVDFAQTMGMLL